MNFFTITRFDFSGSSSKVIRKGRKSVVKDQIEFWKIDDHMKILLLLNGVIFKTKIKIQVQTNSHISTSKCCFDKFAFKFKVQILNFWISTQFNSKNRFFSCFVEENLGRRIKSRRLNIQKVSKSYWKFRDFFLFSIECLIARI